MTCGLGVAARRLFCFFRDGLDGAPEHSTEGKAYLMEAFDGTGLGYLCCPHVRPVAHPKCWRSPADQTVVGANRVDCISGVEKFAQVSHVFEISSLLLQHCTAPGSIQSFSKQISTHCKCNCVTSWRSNRRKTSFITFIS